MVTSSRSLDMGVFYGNTGIDSVLSLPSLLALYVDNHRARTFPFEPSCAPTHAAVSAMGPPRCCCGQRHCAELVTAKARATWAEEQGAKWDWHSDRQAYWYLCLPCHKKFWNDGRSKSPWSQPGRAPWGFQVGGRARLLSGDFYLTEAPPDLGPDRRATPADAPVPRCEEALCRLYILLAGSATLIRKTHVDVKKLYAVCTSFRPEVRR